VFSDEFTEGRQHDVYGGFPADSQHYTDDYRYLSDSDLEDGSSYSGEDEEEPQRGDGGTSQRRDEKMGFAQEFHTVIPGDPSQPPSPAEEIESPDSNRSLPSFVRYFGDQLTYITLVVIAPPEWAESSLFAIWEP
jgi:hypothetical protein